jgi:NADPH:quinone reductase
VPTTMRAATIVDGRVEPGDRSVPEPVADQVVVRVAGAGLNRADLVQVAGHYPPPPGIPADIPGIEVAGTVSAVGDRVFGLAPGDRVLGLVGGAGQAEHVLTVESHLARVPEHLDLVAAGGVPEAFVTAHDALFTRGRLQPGETVLVTAVGSGVGTAAAQLARAVGATVVGTSRTADKLERCREHGLAHGIVAPRDLDPDVLAREIVDAAGPVDVVIDLVGGPYVAAALAAAGLRGRIVVVGNLAGRRADTDLGALMVKRLELHGTVLRSRSTAEKALATAAFAHQVLPLLDRGLVVPVVDAVVPLDRVADAYALLASDTTFGKVVLDCR